MQREREREGEGGGLLKAGKFLNTLFQATMAHCAGHLS
jgi:hypothetical protein